MAEIRVEALQTIYDGQHGPSGSCWWPFYRAESNYQGPISSAKGLKAAVENLKADAEKRVKEKSMRTAMSVDTTVDITMSNEEFEDLLKAERKKVWELASKIASPVSKGGYTSNELNEIFGCCNSTYILHNFPVEEALKKVEAYDRIKVGDEVEIQIRGETTTAYVVKVSQISNPDLVVITVPSGDPLWITMSNKVKKTGRHSDALEKCIKGVITYGEENK